MHNPDKETMLMWLEGAYQLAKVHSGCIKVQVGSIIVSSGGKFIARGSNKTDGDMCKTKGCWRVECYGENDKRHRNPDDCRAVHSEIEAICGAGCNLNGATIYVTRYPCENCARAIVAAGISQVIYGRAQVISDMAKDILEGNFINVIHVKDFNKEDVIT